MLFVFCALVFVLWYVVFVTIVRMQSKFVVVFKRVWLVLY